MSTSRTTAPRRGFTLVEMLIALVLLAIVGGVIIRLLVTSQRLSRQQSEQVMLQSSVRTGGLLVPSELREIGVTATTSDIISAGATDITYRALRTSGVACAVTQTRATLRTSLLFGYRTLAAGRDSLFMFMEGDPSIATDDRWSRYAVTGTPTTGTCPDGTAATLVPVTVAPESLAVMETTGVPVRSFEVMQLALFQDAGKYWLGARSVSGGEAALQPVLGPLKADGLNIEYLGANGAAATGNAIRMLQVTIIGTSQHAVSKAGSATLQLSEDTLVTRIRLRNAPSL